MAVDYFLLHSYRQLIPLHRCTFFSVPLMEFQPWNIEFCSMFSVSAIAAGPRASMMKL